MIRFLIMSACIATCCTGFSAELKKLNVNNKLSLSSKCTSGTGCQQNIQVSTLATLETNLTIEETAAFGPDTIIGLTVPLTGGANFRLGDIGLQPGKTSVTFTTTTVISPVVQKTLIKVSWTNGKLLVHNNQSIKVNTFTPTVLSELESLGIKIDPSTDKAGIPHPVILTATNGPTEFVRIATNLKATDRNQIFMENKPNGDSRQTISQTLKGNQFEPLGDFPIFP